MNLKKGPKLAIIIGGFFIFSLTIFYLGLLMGAQTKTGSSTKKSTTEQNKIDENKKDNAPIVPNYSAVPQGTEKPKTVSPVPPGMSGPAPLPVIPPIAPPKK